MIEIVYNKPYNRVTVKGHAEGEDSGHNIPCGCASILAYTLAANVGNLVGIGAARDETIALEVGNAEIGCVPVRKHEQEVRNAYEHVCVGFEILQDVYPTLVKYEIRGK